MINGDIPKDRKSTNDTAIFRKVHPILNNIMINQSICQHL